MYFSFSILFLNLVTFQILFQPLMLLYRKKWYAFISWNKIKTCKWRKKMTSEYKMSPDGEIIELTSNFQSEIFRFFSLPNNYAFITFICSRQASVNLRNSFVIYFVQCIKFIKYRAFAVKVNRKLDRPPRVNVSPNGTIWMQRSYFSSGGHPLWMNGPHCHLFELHGRLYWSQVHFLLSFFLPSL